MLSLRLARRFGSVPHISAAASAAVGLADGASSTGNSVVSSKIKKPTTLEEPALIKLKKERDPEKLFNLFKANAYNRIVVENRFAFEDTISRLAGAHRFDYIEQLLEHQKTLLQGRREGFIVRIIMLYGRAGMTQHAIKTFYDMHLYGCLRTVKSFNAALKVVTEARDLQAIELFLGDTWSKFDIQLDAVSFNIVIKAFCEMGILDKAYLVLLEMEKLGVGPDVFTYTTLISALYKFNRWEIANGLWNLMVHKGCLPNLATYNVRIQFLVNRGRAWDANKLMDVMQHFGIYPDEVTFNLVIKGFCRAGFLEMAKRVYTALDDQGCKPNSKIYQTMIHYLCKAGDFDLAYTMCKDSMRRNWFPSVESLYKLLEGLHKVGKLGQARFIVTLAQNRRPPFSKDQLASMQFILSKGLN